MMKMIICIVGVICMMLLILLIISSCYLYNFKAKAALLPPGSMGWPIVGETLDLLRAGWDGCPERFIRERVERHGSSLVFKTSLLGDPVAVLCGPAGNKFLFSNENKLVAMWWPKSVRMVFGSCLITSGGEEAKWMRKMIHSYFTPDRNSHHTPIIDQLTRHHLLSHWHGKREVSVFEAIKSHTFKVACRLFMSLEDEDELEKLASLFHILLKGMIQIPFNLPGTRFNRAMRAASAIRKLILVIVKQRKSSLELAVLSSSSSQDLLSHLLLSCDDENGRFLTENEIVNNILTLLFAGHDTSTVAITLLIKTLGQLPQVYQQVLREQSEIAQAKGAGEMLQREDIQKMRYSWNVVSEVMRLSPPVIGAFREALVDFTYAGYIIPKGWKLYWSAFPTQRDEKYFPNTVNFDPSRFEGAGPAPFTYVPFGGGPRMCLGKEFARLQILVFLHNVITRFKWDLLFPDEKIEYDPMPTPVKGLPIRLHPH